MSSHSLATVHQKYDALLSRMEISHNFHTLFKAFPLARKKPCKVRSTINEDHMMYGSWDIRDDRQFFCYFGPFYCPFDSPNNPKNQIFEKMDKSLKILSYLWYTNDIIWYMLPEIWSITDNFLLFWVIFCSF